MKIFFECWQLTALFANPVSRTLLSVLDKNRLAPWHGNAHAFEFPIVIFGFSRLAPLRGKPGFPPLPPARLSRIFLIPGKANKVFRIVPLPAQPFHISFPCGGLRLKTAQRRAQNRQYFTDKIETLLRLEHSTGMKFCALEFYRRVF